MHMFDDDFGHIPYPSIGTSSDLGGTYSGNDSRFWTRRKNRIWADELIDADYITPDMFSDPGMKQAGGEWGNDVLDVDAAGYEHELNYGINDFFRASSISGPDVGDGQSSSDRALWNWTGGAGYNKMRLDLFPRPEQSFWIADNAHAGHHSHGIYFWDGAAGYPFRGRSSIDLGVHTYEQYGSKLFGFLDGSVRLLRPREYVFVSVGGQDAWSTPSGNGMTNSNARFSEWDVGLWDVINKDPQGGHAQHMDKHNDP